MAVKHGDTIHIHYTGTLENGEQFDSSQGKKPLEFTVGAGRMIKGIDTGVVEMELNQEKTLVILPQDAYGEYAPQLVQDVPLDKLPEQLRAKIAEGVVLRLQDPEGRGVLARVTKVTSDNVTIDLNHPLAGKVLKFKVKVVEITIG